LFPRRLAGHLLRLRAHLPAPHAAPAAARADALQPQAAGELMAFLRDTLVLAGDTPGTMTELSFYRIGPADAPGKVYLQAALHADEQPGTMVLHHLLPMLREADEQDLLRARFT